MGKKMLSLCLLTIAVLVVNGLIPAVALRSTPVAIAAIPALARALIAGNIYHVAPYGNDANPGTAEAPWRTIQHAADIVQPGDTVLVHTGTYTEEVTFSSSGMAGAPITFTAAPDEVVTIQGSLTLAQGTSHLNLLGFAVQGFQYWGITLQGDNHHVRLSCFSVAGGEAGLRLTEGYSGEDPSYGPVSDVVVEDSVIYDAVYTAVDCTPGPCDRMAFRRLEIYGSGLSAGFGGDGLGLERGQDVLVEDCFIHDNGGDGIDLNSRNFTGNVPGILVRRNRVVRNHLQGIKLWAGGRMENNAIWGQGINPVMVGAYTSMVEMFNNTITYNMYDPSYSERDYAFVAAYPEEGFSPPVTLTLVNNIFAFNSGPQVGTPTGIYLGPGVRLTEHHNLYWSREDGEIQAEFVTGHDSWFTRAEIADGTWTRFTGQGQGDVTANPLFISGWSAVDPHLRAGSPAINDGTANGAPRDDLEGRARDARPDIGAYEWVGGTPSPSPATPTHTRTVAPTATRTRTPTRTRTAGPTTSTATRRPSRIYLPIVLKNYHQVPSTSLNPNPPAFPVKLIFIHHSTGEGWLADDQGRLGTTLRDNNYFVSDTNYGWGPDNIGDYTDIGHWWTWFCSANRDTYMAALYNESGQNSSYSRQASDPGGENQIIMFKSCFPNSNLGGNPNDPPTTGNNPLREQDAGSEYMTVGNAKGIYNDILAYFATRQDKLFIVITAPPLVANSTDAAYAANARAFNNWLGNDWLNGYPHNNVAVFDFYNVLTSNGGNVNVSDLGWNTGNHHRWWNGVVQHLQTMANNYSAYGSDPWDSHPTSAGGRKASAEFVKLLNVFYHRWAGN